MSSKNADYNFSVYKGDTIEKIAARMVILRERSDRNLSFTFDQFRFQVGAGTTAKSIVRIYNDCAALSQGLHRQERPKAPEFFG